MENQDVIEQEVVEKPERVRMFKNSPLAPSKVQEKADQWAQDMQSLWW
jgi:hypothetical protein